MTSTLWEWLPWVLHALHLTERASGTGEVVVEEKKDRNYLHLGPNLGLTWYHILCMLYIMVNSHFFSLIITA